MTDDDIRNLLRAKAAEATVSDDAWTKIAARIAEPAPRVTHLPRRLAAAAAVAAVAAGVVVVAQNRPDRDSTPVAQSTTTSTTTRQIDALSMQEATDKWIASTVPADVEVGERHYDVATDGDSATVRFTGGKLATELRLVPLSGVGGWAVAGATSELIRLDQPVFENGLLSAAVVIDADGAMRAWHKGDAAPTQTDDLQDDVVSGTTVPLRAGITGETAVTVWAQLTTADGSFAISFERITDHTADPADPHGSYVAVWPATDAPGLAVLQGDADAGLRRDLLDPIAVAGFALTEALPRSETTTSFALEEFQAGDPSSGEVPFVLSDGTHGTVLLRRTGDEKTIWFASGITTAGLEIVDVRREPEDLVVDVKVAHAGTLTWVGATPIEAKAGQTVSISRHDGPTVGSSRPIVIKLVEGKRTLGIVAALGS